MLNFKTISGVVSNLQFSTETSGSMNKGSGSVHTKQTATFRLDGRSVVIKLPERPDIAEGERVTVVGEEKKGMFKALVMRNDATNVIFTLPAWQFYLFGGVMLLLGIMTLIIILGIFVIPVALFIIFQGYRYAHAVKILEAHPALLPAGKAD